VVEGDDRARIVAVLLRQLWFGLSSYRLFPGNPERAGFVAAVDRIGDAARVALAGGPVDVEVRGEDLVFSGAALAGDDATTRLALACFERRIERLAVQAVPTAQDLERTCAILSMTPDALEDLGGAQAALVAEGVTAIVLSALGPSAVEGADHVPEEMVGADLGRVPDASALASRLGLEALRGAPDQQAETLLERLRTLVTQLSVEVGREIDLHTTVHDVVTDLPPDLRQSLMGLLVERVLDDPLAERLIGTMSNAELTRALVDLGRDGRRDPVELAQHLAGAGIRHLDIVDLTTALEAGQVEAGTIMAGLEGLGVDLMSDSAAARGSVTDAIAGYLRATERDDIRAMQTTLARTDDQRTRAALLALRDYLSLESDPERLGEVLFLWAEELRVALGQRDPSRVRVLLDSAREAFDEPGGERESLFNDYVRQALSGEVVLDLVAVHDADRLVPVSELLEPFGEQGVEALLDLLADEPDRERRAHLLAALRQTARGHTKPVLARLRDPRWYVVRNAANLLGNAGGGEVLDQLARACRHTSPQVRKEAVKALLVAGGVRAVPRLRILADEGPEDVRSMSVTVLGGILAPEAAEALGDVARGSRDRRLRRLAVEELAAGAEGREVLRELAIGAGRPRLPWNLRRQARRLLREAERSAA
jgi:HEAT repeat protein